MPRKIFHRHLENDGFANEDADANHQQFESAGPRTVDNGTGAVFGPFQPGRYEVVAVDNADQDDGVPANMVYRYQKESETGILCVEDQSHIWNCSHNGDALELSFDDVYNRVSFMVISGTGTNLLSFRRVVQASN